VSLGTRRCKGFIVGVGVWGRRREKEIEMQWDPVGMDRNEQEWTGEVVIEWSDSDGMEWDGMIVEWSGVEGKGREQSSQS